MMSFLWSSCLLWKLPPVEVASCGSCLWCSHLVSCLGAGCFGCFRSVQLAFGATCFQGFYMVTCFRYNLPWALSFGELPWVQVMWMLSFGELPFELSYEELPWMQECSAAEIVSNYWVSWFMNKLTLWWIVSYLGEFPDLGWIHIALRVLYGFFGYIAPKIKFLNSWNWCITSFLRACNLPWKFSYDELPRVQIDLIAWWVALMSCFGCILPWVLS